MSQDNKSKITIATMILVMVAWLFLCACVVASDTSRPSLVIDDSVDVVELCHYYDGDGKIIFHQLCFYDWPAAGGDCVFVSCKLLKNADSPRPSKAGDRWVTLYDDTAGLRRVSAKSFREVHTQVDPEQTNIEDHQGRRRGLTDEYIVEYNLNFDKLMFTWGIP